MFFFSKAREGDELFVTFCSHKVTDFAMTKSETEVKTPSWGHRCHKIQLRDRIVVLFTLSPDLVVGSSGKEENSYFSMDLNSVCPVQISLTTDAKIF
jgi:hypothetical protein